MHTSNTLSRKETWRLLALVGAGLAILNATFQGDGAPLVASIALCGIVFAVAFSLIRWLGPAFIKAGLKGKDMAKPSRPEIPETMGAVCAVVYLMSLIMFIPFAFYKDIVAATSGGGNRDVVIESQHIENGRFLHRFPHGKLASYLSGLLSLQSVVILGIGDDLFDIRWRHKVLIPAFSAIPMLIVYFVDFGVTQVVVPVPLQPYLGDIVDLGWLYYMYMAAVSIFCPNAINMLAGINGIEVAQSLVIAIQLLFNDAMYLAPMTPYPHPATDSHLLSIYFLLPFIGVSTALLFHNWCSWAIRTAISLEWCLPWLASLGISAKLLPLGCWTLLSRSGRAPPSPLIDTSLRLLHTLRLVRITQDENGRITESSNLTLLNLWLVWMGPMREDQLAWHMVAVQTVCGMIGLFVRHRLALLVFHHDNREFGFIA
ncbi:hypothetical protein N7530_009215 [Penicillium desertorum]|uniref:UDP-N-acetylglucosamine--dolichyl-phosphate N-acetylglucosaminephosphotransferase n=1 Tax=Penicillium desertorum TaxID=1303715 RepID=A0A9W9WI28_9EURO|nr:hypothetical protein N7530_009215 [Penicillium desertorum]